MKRPRMNDRLENMNAYIRKKSHTILLFPLTIGMSAVRRGNAFMRHWVAIEYTRWITNEVRKAVAGHFEMCALEW
jgi:hypothetical protein